MGSLTIRDFGGVIPVKGDRALPEQFAVEAINTWLYGDELRGIRPPVQLEVINAATQRVFRIPKRTVGGDPAFPGIIPPPSYLGDSVWLQFTDPDTDIVRGQLVEDSFERYYFCSPTAGPSYNTYARLVAGLSGWKLGVPGPNVVVSGTGTNADKPTITSISGGTVPVVTRAYVYTWTNIYGEESAPSLPVIGAGNANGTWNIGNIKDPPAAAGYAGYSHKTLYRTVTGASGQTTYYKVAQIALLTTTFADNGANFTDAILVNMLRLESALYSLPPATLKGFIAMPNGFLIGWDDSDIYMSESYHWHAWPTDYKLAVETPIVGMGVIGQTCVVCTQGYPYTISGTAPATCSFTKTNSNEPCLSRGSIVSTPNGVLYASQNGLILVGGGAITNVTDTLITREEWKKDYAPQYLRAVRYQNGYLALRNIPLATNSGFFLDPTDLAVALTEMSEFDTLVGMSSDFWSGEIFLIDNSKVFQWDAPSANQLPTLWRSKEFQLPVITNFAVYAVYWDESRYSTNSYATDIIGATDRARFRVWANRVLVYDKVIPTNKNGKPLRLPSGFKSDIWQFEIRARAPVYTIQVANSEKELRNV